MKQVFELHHVPYMVYDARIVFDLYAMWLIKGTFFPLFQVRVRWVKAPLGWKTQANEIFGENS